MELDQKLFQKVWNVFARPIALEEADLERFRIFATFLARRPMQVLRAGDLGGYAPDCVFLPSLQLLSRASRTLRRRLRSLADQPGIHDELKQIRRFYRVRILNACESLGYLDPSEETPFADNLMAQRLECRKYLERLGLTHFYHGPRLSARTGTANPDQTSVAPSRQRETEKTVHMDATIQQVQENKKEIQDYTLNHSFEKIETLEEFQGNWRELDGSDQIEEQSQALEELKFNQVIRTEEQSAGYLKSDHAGFASEIAGAVDGPFLYPEWDYRKSRFRPNHCSVSESEPRPEAGRSVGNGAQALLARNHRTLHRMKNDLNRILNRFAPVPRQISGEDIDVDAAVEYLVDRSIGQTPSERLYRKKRRNLREVDLLLLLDNSLSTDSYRNGIRVLDAERDAMILFGEALSDAGLPFACYSFSSRTRHNCQVLRLHGFSDAWRASRKRVMDLEPMGYTRIGPALRHATGIMEKRRSRHRWIVLFTDGHPNDYDRYEGRYGQEDVRHAILEAEAQGIGIHLLSFDRARDVFGGYAESALNLARLPDHLLDFYSRIMGA